METGTGEIHRAEWPHRLGRWLRLLSALAILTVITLFGARQIAAKVAAVKPVQFIGHSDDAAYALLGQSLAQGRGISVPYISTFFIPYPQTITHREDHWPPFMGLSIAPLFYFFGEQAWIARLPAIFYGSIGLPLATALLTYALSRRGYAALFAALLIMSNGQLYQQSERTLSDIATAMLVAGFLGSLILSRRHPWMHLVAGALAAGAYFAKGSELYLIALYPLLAAMCAGISIFRRRWVYLGLATTLFLIAPFLYGNWRDYSNPIHSTQNYVSGFFGFENWDSHFYFPYWGHHLPQPSDRWRKHPGEYPEMVHAQVAEALGDAFSGGRGRGSVWRDWGSAGLWLHRVILGTPSRFWLSTPGTHVPIRPVSAWESPIYELAAVAAAALVAALLLAALWATGRVLWQRTHAGGPLDLAPHQRRVRPGPVLAVVLVFCLHVAFLAFFWHVEPRFCFPLLPLLLALGCTAATCALEWPLELAAWLFRSAYETWRLWRGDIFIPRARRLLISPTAAATATLLSAALLLGSESRVRAAQQQLLNVGTGRTFPFSVDNRFVREGEWIAAHLPHAVVMCRNPWELQFSMGPANKSVGLPYPRSDDPGGAEKIFAIARYYGVTHLLADDVRPALRPYLLQRLPGMKRVVGSPMPLFELDWTKLPTATVQQVLADARPPG